MNQMIINSLVISLLSTIFLEMVFFTFLGKLFITRPNKKDFLLVIFVNILTNPVVVLLYWLTILYTELNINIALIPLELFAILTEGYYYKKYSSSFDRPYLFSFIVNMFSYWIGVLLFN